MNGRRSLTMNCRIAQEIAFALLELCGSLAENNVERACWPEWVVCFVVASERSEDVDCRYVLCYLRMWSVSAIFHWHLARAQLACNSGLIHKAVFLCKAKVWPYMYARLSFLIWHYMYFKTTRSHLPCLLHSNCPSRKFSQREINKILEMPFWMRRKTWRQIKKTKKKSFNKI